MKKSYTGLTKFAVLTLMLGIFSPSVTTDHVQVKQSPTAFTNIFEYSFTFTLLKSAEARPIHRQTRRVSRRTSRRTSRRVNYRHNAGRYYGGGHHHVHHHHGHHHHGAPILAFAGGLAIGSIIAASTMPSSCTTVSVGGVAYRRCNNEYYQPFYQGDTLVYKRVPAP